MGKKKPKKRKPSVSAVKQGTSFKQKTSSRSSAFRKQFLLSVIAVLLLAGYFSIGYTREWFKDKILNCWDEFTEQKDKMSLESRMTTRFGAHYTNSKSVAEFLIKRGSGDKLLLVPPNDYLVQRKMQYKVPEPAIFYYYTGLKTVWANSELAYKANWYLTAANGKLVLDSVMNKKQLDSVIDQFRKYKISL